MKRSAYWFLGEYCCQLTGSPAYADPGVGSPQSAGHTHGQSPPSKPNPGGSDDLLDVWGSSAPSRSEGGTARPAAAATGFGGLEAGARAVAHPVVSAMNGATVSIMMRLKHAAMFEDFQVRLPSFLPSCWDNLHTYIDYTGAPEGRGCRVVYLWREPTLLPVSPARLAALCLVFPLVLLWAAGYNGVLQHGQVDTPPPVMDLC